MKKFKFRLEAVLEYRVRIRDEAKGALLKANQALAQAQEELARLKALELENILSIQEISPVSNVILNSQIAEGLKLRIEHQSALIKIREEEVARAMEIYMEASKELKAVTTLKERKLQEYKEKLAKSEAAYFDELTTQRAFMNKTKEDSKTV